MHGNEGATTEPDSKDPAEQTGVEKENKGQDSKTFSQDEVNDIVSKRINEVNAKNEEKTAKAIQDALADYERKTKLSDEEKAREEQERLKTELANKDRDLKIRENRVEARIILQEKSMPDVFADYVVTDDLETTKSNIDKFEKVWNEAVSKAVDQKMAGKTPDNPSNNPQPNGGDGKKGTYDLLFGKKG